VQAARTSGAYQPSGDTAIEPLLASPAVARRPAWQYITGIVLLVVLLLLRFCITSVKSWC
jgi:hypothetical protein